ncbi:MAG: Gfo/Idh/MocA family oxidoreductase [Armatimonadota bacterium]|nr:Gfo/Idh/MocA family oxidoreductase [Armatimonadota bacterium]
MVRVGVAGMGFMGQQHFTIYRDMDGVELVAVCDKEPERVSETASSIGGNIGEATELDLSQQARYLCFEEMLDTQDLDLVDICTPTYLHAEMAVAALEAGSHVVCEKPMARTVAQCDEMIQAAERAGRMLFIAQCIRFWPEYEVLQSLVEGGELGEVKAARFVRQSPAPGWASEGWLMDPELSGGALLDLHIHDVDFILSLFGTPNALLSRGINIMSEGAPVDHVETTYVYTDMVCSAQGGWVMPDSFPFNMAYQVLGTEGLLTFSVNEDPPLRMYPFDGEPYTPDYEPGTGYERELAYFVQCVEEGVAPERVTPESARQSVRLVMAEADSIQRREKVIIG